MRVSHVSDVLGQARDAMSVKQVFGEPYQQDGVTVIPVAKIAGGGGGGGGESGNGESGSGVGFGLHATPAGVFVINGETVNWIPAVPRVDVNRIVIGGQFVGVVLILTVKAILLTWLKSRQRRYERRW